MALWQHINMEKTKTLLAFNGETQPDTTKTKKNIQCRGGKKIQYVKVHVILSSCLEFSDWIPVLLRQQQQQPPFKRSVQMSRVTGEDDWRTLSTASLRPCSPSPSASCAEKKNRAPINASSSILDFYPKYVYITNIPRKLLGNLDN